MQFDNLIISPKLIEEAGIILVIELFHSEVNSLSIQRWYFLTKLTGPTLTLLTGKSFYQTYSFLFFPSLLPEHLLQGWKVMGCFFSDSPGWPACTSHCCYRNPTPSSRARIPSPTTAMLNNRCASCFCYKKPNTQLLLPPSPLSPLQF